MDLLTWPSTGWDTQKRGALPSGTQYTKLEALGLASVLAL